MDGRRNLWKSVERNPIALSEQGEMLKQELIEKYGSYDKDNKIKRFLEVQPPNICVSLEYHYLMYEVIDAYVCGTYYPALTGACCIGETIFNSLILALREYFMDTSSYKKIYRKESFQNWEEAIDVLSSWGILDSKLQQEYVQLADVRRKAIHLRSVEDFHKQSLRAVNTILMIVDNLFGLGSGVFFWCPGELYVKKDKETLPLVREFIIPKCFLLGYKHRVISVGSDESLVISYEDSFEYENDEVSDQRFRELRIEWKRGTKE